MGRCGTVLDPYSADPDACSVLPLGLKDRPEPREGGEAWHIEHKIPQSRPDVYEAVTGKTNVHDLDNLQLSCAHCNHSKRDRLLPAYVPDDVYAALADFYDEGFEDEDVDVDELSLFDWKEIE